LCEGVPINIQRSSRSTPNALDAQNQARDTLHAPKPQADLDVRSPNVEEAPAPKATPSTQTRANPKPGPPNLDVREGGHRLVDEAAPLLQRLLRAEHRRVGLHHLGFGKGGCFGGCRRGLLELWMGTDHDPSPRRKTAPNQPPPNKRARLLHVAPDLRRPQPPVGVAQRVEARHRELAGVGGQRLVGGVGLGDVAWGFCGRFWGVLGGWVGRWRLGLGLHAFGGWACMGASQGDCAAGCVSGGSVSS
jgi:hypothetical protein